ncbi:PhoPQ-activated pathogenicity-related family protein [Roseiconus lacunae]|uniref:PhoPQ-activated pathogenicity-related family protein n=1 Tax=Roseiconus lacunae TaxID=2605694 RepID=UPI001E4C6CB9|nr:PhoPQ-activated protein PqaA family protein [Roseiconus lacunae]MCD0462219.1 PhoPQ-activated pathogenicity-related family protein [Roseiconus lacunae]
MNFQRLCGSIIVAIVIGTITSAEIQAQEHHPESNPVATEAKPFPTALIDYVKQSDDDVFRWEHLGKMTTAAGTVHQLRVTSQTWQGIVWKHAVEVYEPKNIRFENHAVLYVTGGSTPSQPRPSDIVLGVQLANQCGARVVMLHQTPNQPLLGNRREDDLISETWLRYLETGDATWPLLFPMVKSAVRTMDAIGEFSEQSLSSKVEHFVITGASKRGWTSWLSPVADNRIIATAPIVIDVLNFRKQMDHQIETWGSYSRQIADYTRKGLVKTPSEKESEREAALREMMDPFTYRSKLTLPKLLIVGTNDPYWTVDAMNLYWNDLVGPKFIRQVPNAGHGLEGGREGAVASLAAFFRHCASGETMPKAHWQFEESGRELTLSMLTDHPPKEVRLWTAQSETKDFRKAKWSSKVIAKTGDLFVGRLTKPESKHVAAFGEFVFADQVGSWSITTLVYRR